VTGCRQQVTHVARGPVDQLAVGGQDPGHQVALEASQPAHHQRGVDVEQQLQQQVLQQVGQAQDRHVVRQVLQAEADPAA
jgi:hypothetical protein